jgi:hypothetical protein
MKQRQKAMHEMEHGADIPLPPRWLRQLIDERMESFWTEFRRFAVLLNEAGAGPCELIEVIEEMDASGELINCGACNHATGR